MSLGKFGSFSSNSILGRPYHLTYEILDKVPGEEHASSQLRIVAASELNAEVLDEESASASESCDENPGVAPVDEPGADDDAQYDIIGPNGEVLVRNNRLTVDSSARQKLSSGEIEQLKLAETGSGRAIIAKIMESHTALDEKTAFSLAKYTLRKKQKYLRRFTVLPLDVPMLASYILNEKDAGRTMELREETLSLIASWSNVHSVGNITSDHEPIGRWLVVDDTIGLLVALLAERMGLLHEDRTEEPTMDEPPHDPQTNGDTDMKDTSSAATSTEAKTSPKRHTIPERANSNTITLVHTALQPNVSSLNYFGFDLNSASPTGYASPTHPLHKHFRTLTWLELLAPEASNSSIEPEAVSAEVLATWKSSKRGTYHRKRRRWEKSHATITETRAGGFDGLVVASSMDPSSVLRALVPLLRGGAPVVVYNPAVESLVELVDVYSGARKTAFLQALAGAADGVGAEALVGDESDFPVDPRLLLAPSLQTVRANQWQVLPGRTHPMMTGRGGAEGYVFTALRVLPAEGNVQARGRFAKKRKTEGGDSLVVGGVEEDVS